MGGEILTIVFADAERSTELLVERGDDAGRAALADVLDVVTARAADYDGRAVKSLGDGVLLVFPAPRQAVAFAVVVQRALTGRVPALRVGINAGEVTGGSNDPVGEAVNAAARIAAKASGGEVLVSDVVRQLVGTIPGVRFADRGRTRLKGFPDRWRLHAAMGSDQALEAAPTFGRTPELAAVDTLLARASGGRGHVVVLEGEGGIGKTHVVDAAVGRAYGLGFTTLVARGEELEPDRAGRLLLGWAAALGPSVAVPSTADVLDGSAGFALATAVADGIEDRATGAPVLVVAEDLQWADELSLRGLATILRRIAALPVAVVATLRPAPRPPLLEKVLAAVDVDRAVRLTLAGLDDVAVAALASTHAGAPPGPNLLARLAGAGGNPLFLLEILRSLDEDGRTRVEAGIAEIGASDLPSSLRETVVRRVRSLPSTSVELLRLACLLGRAFTLADLATVAGRRVVDVAADLQVAVDAAVLMGDGATLSFRHDLLREAIYEDMPDAIRRDLHAAAGRALATAGAPALQVARQVELGARPGDLVAVEWLQRAAVETGALDVAQAVALFEQALRVAGDGWPGRRGVELAMLEPLAMAGRVEEAQELGRVLLASKLDGADELAVRRALVAVAAASGDVAAAAAEAALAAALPDNPPAEAAHLRCLEANMALLLGRSATEVQAAAEDALAVATVEGDGAALIATAHQTLALLHGAAGRYEDGLVHARASSRALARRVSRSGFLIPEIWEGTLLLCLDRFDEALAVWSAQQRVAEETGAMAMLVQTQTTASLLHHLAGRWDEGAAELETAQAVTDEFGNRAHDVGINAIRAWRGLALADPVLTKTALARGEEALALGRHLFGVDALLYVQSRVLAEAGAVGDAYALLAPVWQLGAHLRGLSFAHTVGPELVKLARACDDQAAADAIAADMARLASGTRAAGIAAAALRAGALARDDADGLLAAVARYRDTPRRWELAHTCEDAGRLLIAADRAPDAVPVLEEAIAWHLAMGATGEVARIDALLREHGVRRRRARAATAARGWESLSPTERKVVELVAQGLSNPQIAAALYVSRRTIETHVSHIFRKLDVSSRAELAALAAGRGSVR